MPTVDEMIAAARAKLDAEDPTLETMEGRWDPTNCSMEARAALHRKLTETREVVYEAILTEWLTTNGIPQSEWVHYTFDGVTVRYE